MSAGAPGSGRGGDAGRNPDLLVEARGEVLHVTLNRPEQRNALNASLIEGLLDVAGQVGKEPSRYRAIVMRGAGGVFCAGGDLKLFRDVFQGATVDAAAIEQTNRRYGQVLTAWNRLPVVVITAIEGAAMAGGMGLAAIADVTLATADARFALTETRLGLIPAQISPFVMARVGAHQARRLTLTAATFEAQEAARLGLVDEVVADAAALDAAIERTLAAVLRCAPGANALSKHLIHRAEDLTLENLLDEAARRFATTMLEAEAREGIASFLEKRRAAWLPPTSKRTSAP